MYSQDQKIYSQDQKMYTQLQAQQSQLQPQSQDRTNIKDIIFRLSEQYNTNINDKNVVDDINILRNYTNQEYLKNYIIKLHRPTDIKPETVASFIWGCLQNYYGSVSKSCSLLCTNSLFNHNKLQDCHYQTFLYSRSGLNLITNSEDSQAINSNAYSNAYSTQVINSKNKIKSKAYIYVESDFNGFTDSDINLLKSYSISFAILMSTENNIHNTLITEITEVDKLPKIIKKIIKHSDKPSFNYFWFSFVLVLFIFCFYLNYYKML